MKLSHLCVPLLLVLAAGCDQTPSADLAALQGQWTGKETTGERKDCQLVINGKTAEFEYGDKAGYKASFTLAPTEPKTMTAKIKESAIANYQGKTAKFIYKVEGDTLTLAAREPGDPSFPAGFDDPKARVIVVKK